MNYNQQLNYFLIISFIIFINSCSLFQDPCKDIICNDKRVCIDGICQCPNGYLGESCNVFDYSKVQFLLDEGKTPLELIKGSIPLDSIYGKFYRGGLIFHLNTKDGTGLVAATEDYEFRVTWGCNGIKTNANIETIGGGIINIDSILTNCINEEIAAKICSDLKLNEKDDWYLPSKEELILMWKFLADSDRNNYNLGENDPTNLGKFKTQVYWSSTETYPEWAYGMHFYHGRLAHDQKTRTAYVRACRIFK